jgi:hypothetical protein
MKSHWWLVDSCCGITLSPDKRDFLILDQTWKNGTVQVGTGTLSHAKGRGIVVVYARDTVNGQQHALPQFKQAWYVPDMFFKILSVADLSDNGIKLVCGDLGPVPDYLFVHNSGVKLKVRRYNRIHVLMTVDLAQVHVHVKMPSEELIQPKKHWDIDLWFAVGRTLDAPSLLLLQWFWRVGKAYRDCRSLCQKMRKKASQWQQF